MNKSDEIKVLTGLFRNSDLPYWVRLRTVVRGRGIDPGASFLAVSFEDDINFEYGILVTSERRVIQYGLSYTEPDSLDGVLSEWRDVTDGGLVSAYQQSAADIALALLTPSAIRA